MEEEEGPSGQTQGTYLSSQPQLIFSFPEDARPHTADYSHDTGNEPLTDPVARP